MSDQDQVPKNQKQREDVAELLELTAQQVRSGTSDGCFVIAMHGYKKQEAGSGGGPTVSTSYGTYNPRNLQLLASLATMVMDVLKTAMRMSVTKVSVHDSDGLEIDVEGDAARIARAASKGWLN